MVASKVFLKGQTKLYLIVGVSPLGPWRALIITLYLHTFLMSREIHENSRVGANTNAPYGKYDAPGRRQYESTLWRDRSMDTLVTLQPQFWQTK